MPAENQHFKLLGLLWDILLRYFEQRLLIKILQQDFQITVGDHILT